MLFALKVQLKAESMALAERLAPNAIFGAFSQHGRSKANNCSDDFALPCVQLDSSDKEIENQHLAGLGVEKVHCPVSGLSQPHRSF